MGVQTARNLFEYSDVNVHKANGLREIAALHHFTLDQVMAFGDSDNDVEMLKEVGISVAMGNASESAKQVAKYLTQDNAHDGISNFIKQYLFKETNEDNIQ